jgi:hypothetical protein
MRLTPVIVYVLLSQSLIPSGLHAALGTNELEAAHSQGTNSLDTFRGFITVANHELLGFSSLLQSATVTNAEPLLVYTVPLSRLTNYQLTNEFIELLYPDPQSDPVPGARVIIPVMDGTDVRSSLSLRLVTPAPNARWTNANWGYPNLIRALVTTARSIPPARLGGKDPFVVEIPVFDVWLIGYLDNNSKLILVSTAEMRFGSALIQRHQVVTPAAMYQMRVAAQRYNGFAN